MTTHTTFWRRLSLPLRFTLGAIAILLISLIIFNLLMRPPASEIALMAGFLSVTAVISLAAGYGMYRLGWIERSPTILWTLLGGYALSSVLTFINVFVIAQLMFFNDHDLQLSLVLLLFAGGMAMALGYFLSSTLTDRISRLEQAAHQIAGGDLGARVAVRGQDEMSLLARTFNEMAGQLQEADRQKRELESMRRDLIAWAGHDLQTPLASVRAVVEALADGMVEDGETQQRYLRTAQREIRSLSVLIDDLFQMAQLDAGGLRLDRGLNSLSDLVSDTLESFSELAARQGVRLAGSVAPEAELVAMDAQRIGRVLNNLVGNSLRHTPAGGEVEVRARRIAGAVQVEVVDSGEGIRPEDLAHIFERFYRGEKSRNRTTGGSGLGLAIARGIVEAHGGEIGVESGVQKTRFYFTIPVDA